MNKQVWSQPQISELSLKMTAYDEHIDPKKNHKNVDIFRSGSSTINTGENYS